MAKSRKDSDSNPIVGTWATLIGGHPGQMIFSETKEGMVGQLQYIPTQIYEEIDIATMSNVKIGGISLHSLFHTTYISFTCNNALFQAMLDPSSVTMTGS